MYSRCPSVRFMERFVELAEDSLMLSPIMNKASFSYLAITVLIICFSSLMSIVVISTLTNQREKLRKFTVLMMMLMKNLMIMILLQLVKHLYTPILFHAFGFGNKASLVSAAIIDIVNVVATLGKKIISFPWRWCSNVNIFAWSWGPLGWLILGAW
ncbi:hypothetical protein WN943_010323 [Citrus x changshan-huyou]